MENVVNITPAALSFIKYSIEEQKCNGIRIDIESGGCRGITYSINFAHEIDQADVLTVINDINIYIASKAMPFIQGMKMDYIKTAMGGGIVFENPNATGQCGCGKSFCVDDSGEACNMSCHQ